MQTAHPFGDPMGHWPRVFVGDLLALAYNAACLVSRQLKMAERTRPPTKSAESFGVSYKYTLLEFLSMGEVK